MLTCVHALILTHIAHTVTPAHTSSYACTYTHAHIHTPTFAHGHTNTWAHTQGAHTDTYLKVLHVHMHSCTQVHMCSPLNMHVHMHILLHAHQHTSQCTLARSQTLACSRTHAHSHGVRPPRRHPGWAIPRPRSCLLLSSPDLVTTAWCEPRPQLCHPIPLGYIRVLVLSAPPDPWVGSAGLP